MGKPNREESRRLLHAVWLVVLVSLAEMWANRHLDVGWTNPGILAGPVAVVTAALALLDRVAGQGAAAALADGFFRWVARPSVLGVGSAAFLAVSLCFTTVTVLQPPDGKAGIKVSPLRGSGWFDLSEDAEANRPKMVLTAPFGQPYKVGVSGYVARTFQVFPWVGRVVDPGRDLQPSPSVLFRLKADASGYLNSGGSFKVSRAGGTDGWESNEEGRRANGKEVGAFLVGSKRPIPPEVTAWWSYDLAGQSTTDAAKMMLAWKHPKTVTPRDDLRPGDTLDARVCTVNGSLWVEKTIKLDARLLIDVLMDEPPASEDAPC